MNIDKFLIFLVGVFLMVYVIFAGFTKFNGVVPISYSFLFFGGSILMYTNIDFYKNKQVAKRGK